MARPGALEEPFDTHSTLLLAVRLQDFEKKKRIARDSSMLELPRIMLLNSISFQVLTPDFIMGMLLSCAI